MTKASELRPGMLIDALKTALNVMEKGMEVRMTDKWPALKMPLEDGIVQVKKALEHVTGWDDAATGKQEYIDLTDRDVTQAGDEYFCEVDCKFKPLDRVGQSVYSYRFNSNLPKLCVRRPKPPIAEAPPQVDATPEPVQQTMVESGVCYCGLPMDEHNILSGCTTPRDNPMPASMATPAEIPPHPFTPNDSVKCIDASGCDLTTGSIYRIKALGANGFCYLHDYIWPYFHNRFELAKYHRVVLNPARQA